MKYEIGLKKMERRERGGGGAISIFHETGLISEGEFKPLQLQLSIKALLLKGSEWAAWNTAAYFVPEACDEAGGKKLGVRRS